jgi:hypothetical protein
MYHHPTFFLLSSVLSVRPSWRNNINTSHYNFPVCSGDHQQNKTRAFFTLDTLSISLRARQAHVTTFILSFDTLWCIGPDLAGFFFLSSLRGTHEINRDEYKNTCRLQQTSTEIHTIVGAMDGKGESPCTLYFLSECKTLRKREDNKEKKEGELRRQALSETTDSCINHKSTFLPPRPNMHPC